MVGYIGSKAVTLSTTAADVAGDATINGDLTVKGTTVTIDSAAVQEIRLGDNDKLTFGDATGGDLQIYHDGSASRVVDAGTGGLVLQADANTSITSADGATVSGRFRPATHVSLYYNGSEKLATTSTGVDISDTATNEPTITLKTATASNFMSIARDSSTGHYNFTSEETGSSINFLTDAAGSGAEARMTIDRYGNVGIGTSSPLYNLDVGSGSGSSSINIFSGSTDTSAVYFTDNNTGVGSYIGRLAYNHTADAMLFNTNASERMRIDSSGNVGIGTSSPPSQLSLEEETSNTTTRSDMLRLTAKSSGTTGVGFGANIQFVGERTNGTLQGMGRIGFGASTNTASDLSSDFIVETASAGTPSEALRITSSGNLLVGKTSTVFSTQGAMITAQGSAEFTRNSVVLNLNRTSTDGDIMRGYKDGVNVFSVNRSGYSTAVKAPATSGVYNHLELGASAQNQQTYYLVWDAHNGRFYSAADNTHDVGSPFLRWDDVYATNGTINTSDQNEKQQIASLTDAEITAAKAISKLFKTFKWNDSVAEKGDAARTHSGVIAQDVEQAMTDAGLNAGDYAFFISTTWWETQTEVPAVEADEENGVEAQEAYTRTDTYETAEEAPEGATERNRKGIRYPQLLSFIGAATEQRLASIETRLDALETV